MNRPNIQEYNIAKPFKNQSFRIRKPNMVNPFAIAKCQLARPSWIAGAGNSPIRPSKDWTPIHYAAHYGYKSVLSHFIRHGHSPDGNVESAVSPLLLAIANGHTECVRVLCAAGADTLVRVLQADTPTALHVAIGSGHLDIMDVLLRHIGHDEIVLNAATSESLDTPLHTAAKSPDTLAVVKKLLKLGAAPHIQNAEGLTAAEVAFTSRNFEAAVAIVRHTRQDRNMLRKEKDMLLQHIESQQNRRHWSKELIVSLFEAVCNTDSEVLIEAMKMDETECATILLRRGVDPNTPIPKGILPLFVAIERGFPAMIQLLLDHGVDVTVVDSHGLTVLQKLLQIPSPYGADALQSIFKILRRKGADTTVVDDDGMTLLHHAVSRPCPHAGVAMSLLESGIPVDQLDARGSSALHYACHNRDCLEALLYKGADPSIVNKRGLTPLLLAMTAINNPEETDLEPLVRVSDVNFKNHQGKTALHIAARKGLVRTVHLLLKYGADTKILDASHRSPLMFAVNASEWGAVRLLAPQPGADIHDPHGMTALHRVIEAIASDSSWTNELMYAVVASFCQRGGNRAARNPEGATPLIMAAATLGEQGLPAIKALLREKDTSGARGALNCVDHQDANGRSALYYAVARKNSFFVREMLKAGASFKVEDLFSEDCPIKQDDPWSTLVFKAYADYDFLRRLRSLSRSLVSSSGAPRLPHVFPVERLQMLLSMGLDPNWLPGGSDSERPRSLLWTILDHTPVEPIHGPLPSGYLEAVLKLLFEYQADASSAALVDDNELMFPDDQRCLDPRAPIRHLLSFLLETRPRMDINIFKLLIKQGARISVPSSAYDDRFPLHSAVRVRRADVLAELLTHKANLNLDPLAKSGHTPLFMAVAQGFRDMAALLIDAGADVNFHDKRRRSPLHVAAFQGKVATVEMLLRAGALPKGCENKNSDTPARCIPEGLEERRRAEILRLLDEAEKARQDRIEQEKEAERQEKMLQQSDILQEVDKAYHRVSSVDNMAESEGRQPKGPQRKVRFLDPDGVERSWSSIHSISRPPTPTQDTPASAPASPSPAPASPEQTPPQAQVDRPAEFTSDIPMPPPFRGPRVLEYFAQREPSTLSPVAEESNSETTLDEEHKPKESKPQNEEPRTGLPSQEDQRPDSVVFSGEVQDWLAATLGLEQPEFF